MLNVVYQLKKIKMKTLNITLIVILYLGIAWIGSLLADNFVTLQDIRTINSEIRDAAWIIACDDKNILESPHAVLSCARQ